LVFIKDDEPILPAKNRNVPEGTLSKKIKQKISDLIRDQKFCVLSLKGEHTAYGSLVSFSYTDDLSEFVIPLQRGSRKYNLLIKEREVCLVMDNRDTSPPSPNHIEGVNLLGTADLLCDDEKKEALKKQLVKRHPQLKAFVSSPTCSFFTITPKTFYHIVRFQEIYQWTPESSSSV
tara:strand:- start:871 stop:1398 length:528 start_codon:yes stop_codon:yes gene_type:complete